MGLTMLCATPSIEQFGARTSLPLAPLALDTHEVGFGLGAGDGVSGRLGESGQDRDGPARRRAPRRTRRSRHALSCKRDPAASTTGSAGSDGHDTSRYSSRGSVATPSYSRFRLRA
jgi:hypothetical protein